jgi:hypothetical protein
MDHERAAVKGRIDLDVCRLPDCAERFGERGDVIGGCVDPNAACASRFLDGGGCELADAGGFDAERLTDEPLGQEDGELDHAVEIALGASRVGIAEREEASGETRDLLLARFSRCERGR